MIVVGRVVWPCAGVGGGSTGGAGGGIDWTCDTETASGGGVGDAEGAGGDGTKG